ncbi:DUF1622 domain-containing protein [Deinococcus taeanensis]|uniref:DUF1622 domain-containing protein n=1 Tax=Deinococcus taeanensis TaxID=2737050 RepID=UPI001CDC748B|nr:DUF1622 domain-containing protein [Deinococcus taeanensis]UBV43776.1 DUF1622 domain-containing protein [Deinococcus taeanensis]
MFEAVKHWTEVVATVVEVAAALLIAAATLVALVQAVMAFVRPSREPDRQKESLRLELGRWLAVALEFTLAADILRTAIAPSWDDIGKLAAIATLRTLLNFFLQREIDGHRARHADAAP